MEEQGGLYSPDRFTTHRRAATMLNSQDSLGLPQVTQPTSTNNSNDDGQSPGRISVATVETWPRFTDYQSTNQSRDMTDMTNSGVLPMYNSLSIAESLHGAQVDRSERNRSGPMSLMAMSDIRIRSRYPIQVMCPHCSMDVVTMIVPKRGATVYCGCILMTFIGLCCVPFLLPSMQDIQHICPQCSKLIGTNTPL